MKKSEIANAIDKIESKYLEEYLQTSSEHITEKPQFLFKKSMLPVAAALVCAITVCGGALIPMLVKDAPIINDTSESNVISNVTSDTDESQFGDVSDEIPDATVKLFAAEIQNVFTLGEDAAKISAYSKMFLAPGRTPLLNTLPAGETTSIYKYVDVNVPLDTEEFKAFKDGIMPRLVEALGMNPDSYNKTSHSNDSVLSEQYEKDSKIIMFSQAGSTGASNRIHLYNRNERYNADASFVLNGRELTVDQSKSEEEILESLEWARDILFEVFGRSFDSAKVTLHYQGYGDSGAYAVVIDYYNKADMFRGDYIQIYFDNWSSSPDYPASGTVLKKCVIDYYDYRADNSEFFVKDTSCRLISLEAAEQNLYNGYVFGGHICKHCMASQDGISFEDYDFVGFEYVGDMYCEEPVFAPFYVFYKEIGKADNGEIEYAKAYVSAIELSGLEDLFENQSLQHDEFISGVTE